MDKASQGALNDVFCPFFVRFAWCAGWRAPPEVSSVSLRSRSFWLPCPPAFGGLRPVRAAPLCDQGLCRFAQAVAPLSFYLAFWVPFPCYWDLVGGLRSVARCAGWRFFWGFRPLARPGPLLRSPSRCSQRGQCGQCGQCGQSCKKIHATRGASLGARSASPLGGFTARAVRAAAAGFARPRLASGARGPALLAFATLRLRPLRFSWPPPARPPPARWSASHPAALWGWGRPGRPGSLATLARPRPLGRGRGQIRPRSLPLTQSNCRGRRSRPCRPVRPPETGLARGIRPFGASSACGPPRGKK